MLKLHPIHGMAVQEERIPFEIKAGGLLAAGRYDTAVLYSYLGIKVSILFIVGTHGECSLCQKFRMPVGRRKC